MKRNVLLIIVLLQLLIPLPSRAQCPAPDALMLVENGYNHSLLSWSTSENISTWQLSYVVRNYSNYYQYMVTDTLQLSPNDDGAVQYLLDTLPSASIIQVYLRPLCGDSVVAMASSICFCTPCAPIPSDSLPYHYGFEDFFSVPSFGTVLTPCWWLSPQSPADSTGRPSTVPYYQAEGSRSLFISATESMPRSWVSAPLVADSLHRLEVTFQAMSFSDNTSFEVGVMTNPLDYNSFSPITVCSIQGTSTWNHFSLTFEDYRGPQGFLTIMVRGQNSMFLDDFNVNHITCPEILNVAVRDVTSTSAFVEWQHNIHYPVQPYAFQLTVTDLVGQPIFVDTLANQWSLLNGLLPATSYYVSLRALCDTCSGGSRRFFFTTRPMPCLALDSLSFISDSIGQGTGVSYDIPFFSGSHYARSQQIFRASELGTPRVLTHLALMPSLSAETRHLKVYLAHTADSTLEGYSSPSDMRVVFDDTLNLVADQWCFLPLSTPFVYNGQANLLVTFYDDNPVLTGSPLQFYVHQSYANASRYDYKNTYRALGDGTGLAMRNNIIFEGYPCDSSLACAAPLVRVVDSTVNSLSFVWAPGGDESLWTVEYRMGTNASWTLIADTDTTRWTLAGLQPDSDYQIRVSHQCADTLFATVRTVHTPCPPHSLPFDESFASWPTGNQNYLPACWKKGNTSTGNSPYATYFQHMGDYRSLLFNYTNSYSSNGYYAYLSLPKMEAPVDTLMLSFYMFIEYESYNQNMRVGVSDNPTDMTTFREVGVATQSVPGQWELHQFTFNGIPDGYITLLTPSTGYATVYIDNITVDYFNPCQSPVDISLDSVDHHNAWLSWTANGAPSYQVQYGPSGFTLGNGTSMTVSSNGVMLPNLTFETNYDFYVRAICDAQHSSPWNGPFQFLSGCNTIDALPYFVDFDNMGVGMFPPPACWGYGSDYNSAYPQVNSSLNHGSGTGSGLYFNNNDYYGVGRYTYASMPALSSSVASVSQTQLYLYTRSNTSGGPYPLVVGVCDVSADLSTFVPVDTLWVTYGEWTGQDVYLESYTGTGRYITFVQYSLPQTTGNSLWIDDITLSYAESCHTPNQLQTIATTQNSASVGWNDRAGASQWIVEYGPLDFQPGTGTMILANSNPFTLTGLPPNYNGEFYVRALCSPGDTSGYSAFSAHFVTPQQPATTPYSYDFENPAEWSNWTTLTNNNSYCWLRSNYPQHLADTGSYSLFMAYNYVYYPYPYNTTVNAVAYRDIICPTAGDYMLTFDARAGGPLYDEGDGLRIFLVDPSATVSSSSANATTPWGPVDSLNVVFELCADTVWQTYNVYLENISGPQRLVFYWGNINRPYHTIKMAAVVDNVSLSLVTCPRPYNLQVDSVGPTYAALSWQGSASSYTVVCENDRAGATQPQTFVVSGNSILLTDLQQAHRYRFVVRSNCNVGDSSVYSEPLTFVTDSCVAEFWSQMGDVNHASLQSFYTPVNLLASYSVSEIIIPQSELDTVPIDLSGVAFNYQGQQPLDEKDLVEIYIMPTSKSCFDSVADAVNLTATACKVYTGALTCHQGWNYFGFDNYYHYAGSGNLMLVVNDLSNHGIPSQIALQNEFRVRRCDSSLTWSALSYNNPINLHNLDYYYGNSAYVFNYRPEMRLYSCGTFYCETPQPVLDVVTYNSAEIHWQSGEGNCEVQFMAADADDWSPSLVVTDTTYTFLNLVPDADYRFRMRRQCDSLRFSEWVEGAFTTAHLDCFRPTNLVASNATTSTVDLSWNGHEGDTAWSVHVWNTTFDTVFDVDTTAVTLISLVSDMRYMANVSTVCGDGLVVSSPSISVGFGTLPCGSVDPLVVTAVTSTSVTLRWTDISAPSYAVEIGEPGFGVDMGRRFITTATSITIDSLQPDHDYEIYAQARCGGPNTGRWSESVIVHTSNAAVTSVDKPSLQLVPNPAHGFSTLLLQGISGTFQVRVVDVTGRPVRTFTLQCGDNCRQTVRLDELPSGAYFVQVVGPNVNLVRKLILK